MSYDKPIGGYTLDKYAFFKKVGYEPMPHQKKYHDSKARFRAACCGRRAGKSTMAAADKEVELLRPDTLGWIVGPTYNLGSKEFRVMWDHLIVGMELGRHKGVRKNFNIKQGDMYIEFPWNSRVEVRSADKPDSLVGEGLDWIIMAEAAKHRSETWQRYLRSSLSDNRGTGDFPTTPEGKNWYYDLWKLGNQQVEFEEGDVDLSDPNQIELAGTYESWQFPSWVNKHVYPGGKEDPEIQLLRETTIEEWFLQEIAASFTAVVGRIYQEFEEHTHVLSPKHHGNVPQVRPDGSYEFNPAWPNYMAFDWGFSNPLAAVEFQVSPDDTVYVWREHYKAHQDIEQHVQELKARKNPPGYRLDLAFGDSADPDAVSYISRNLVHCMADDEAKANWLTGVRKVKSFLKVRQKSDTDRDEFGRPFERPSYYVDPSCEEHIREMQGYRTKDNVKGAELKATKVVSSGVDDHTCDAMRYALMHLYEIGVTAHLEDVYPNWARTTNSYYDKPSSGGREGGLVPVGAAKKSDTFFSYQGSNIMNKRF